VRHAALGAAAADVVDAGFSGALDFLDGQAIEGGRLTQYRGELSLMGMLLDQYALALSTLKLYSWRAEP
jgi:hypothetical protein